jgi:hypothetical protein
MCAPLLDLLSGAVRARRRVWRYSAFMALSADQLKQVDESRQQLADMTPEQSRDVARWLRDEVAPELPSERHRELAEQSASRFEQRAAKQRAD